jgi:hypothetical protein
VVQLPHSEEKHLEASMAELFVYLDKLKHAGIACLESLTLLSLWEAKEVEAFRVQTLALCHDFHRLS